MADASQVVWNNDIEVGKTLKIAARGITPNHVGAKVRADGTEGTLERFEHFSAITVLTLDVGDRFVEVDLAHLDVIEVDA